MTLEQPKAFKQHFARGEQSLSNSPDNSQAITVYDYTAGRCCLYRIVMTLANSTLRGPQADTLLLVDIPSTRGSHTWTLTSNGLLGTYTAPIPPFHFHSAWQDPAQPMWTTRTSSLLLRSSTAHLLLCPCSHSTGRHPQCSSGWPPRCTPS